MIRADLGLILCGHRTHCTVLQPNISYQWKWESWEGEKRMGEND